MEPRTQYARSGDVNIAYQMVGDGPIDLVLAQGWATHLELAWDIPPLARFYRRLAEFTRLILFDKRGTGLSDRVRADSLPTLEQRMEDVVAVMDAAGSEKAAVLGTLGGAAMAVLFAATFPARAVALVLYGSGARLQFSSTAVALDTTEEGLPEAIERTWNEGRHLAALGPQTFVRDHILRDAYARLERSSMSPAAAATMLRMGLQADVTDVLRSVRVPTLVLHRSDDSYIEIRNGRAVADLIEGARFVEVPGVDHLFWLGDTEPILASIQEFLTGSRPEPDLERVLATVLFTDIVGSTETAARLGDHRWLELLDEHHAIVRRCLAEFRGREVVTVGDGFLATFDGPARAIRCALAAQRSVRSLGIEVRAGLHTGECELTGEDIRGIAVHIAARVAALAGAGQVLVSSTVKDLVAGSGIEFAEHGTQVLKGVPGEWRLYAVAP